MSQERTVNCGRVVILLSILCSAGVSPFALDAESRLPAVDAVDSSVCAECHGDATTGAHPVGAYPGGSRTRGAEFTLRPPSAPSGFGDTVAGDFLLNGRIECTSCHVSHDRETTNPRRLRSENSSELCTACHSSQS